MADSLLINLTDGGEMQATDYLYGVRAPYVPGTSNIRISGANIAQAVQDLLNITAQTAGFQHANCGGM